MTDISEAAKAKACELVNRDGSSFNHEGIIATSLGTAFCAFIQEVSDAAKGEWGRDHAPDAFKPFILPEPVDLVIEAMGETGIDLSPFGAGIFRKALARRGLKIVEDRP